MKRLDQTSVGALRMLLEGQPTTAEKVAFAWAVAAGPTLSRAADVRWSDDGTLHVMAHAEAWRQELTRARPVIARRIAELIGPDVVRRVVVDAVPDGNLATNVRLRPRG